MDGRTIWMATWRRQNRCGGKFRRLFGPRKLSCSELQLDVFLLENLRRRNELRTTRGEYRFWIRHTAGLQHLQSLIKLRRNVGKTQFAVEFKNGFEIREREPGPRELVQSRPQLGNIPNRHGESASVSMATITGEQSSARLQSFEQVE